MFSNKERNKLVAQPVYFPLCNRFKNCALFEGSVLTAFAMKGAIHLAKFGKSFISRIQSGNYIDTYINKVLAEVLSNA